MTEAPALKVEVSIPDPRFRAMAIGALHHLGCALGVRLELGTEGVPDLRYGGSALSTGSSGAWVPFWPECYDRAAPHDRTVVDGSPCWLPTSRSAERPADLIGATWRLLALADEAQVSASERDEAGAFLTEALPPARRATIDEPFAEWHAQALLDQLDRGGVRLAERIPRWPNGKTHAVVMTHDVDGPRLQQPYELGKALAKAIARRSAAEGAAFGEGLRSLLLRRPDPYFAFAGWAAAEFERGVRSAFYVYVRSSVRRDRHDPPYVVDGHDRWDVLRRLADDGWELGVHAGIGAADGAEGLRDEREAFQRLVGRAATGVRHHYWRIDWRSPSVTFERQVGAGYEYDASIAWRDRPGFRAGTSLPYFPLSPDGEGVLPLVEVPTALMDGHLFEYLRLDVEAATETATRLYRRVAAVGGVLNADWHERTFCDRYSYRGWRTVALKVLDEISSDAWVTTPADLVRWWRSRVRSVGVPESRGR